MSEQVAHAFIDALGRLESERDVDPIVATFADACDVGNVLAPEQFHGRDGARRFWTEYREAFGEVRSSFRNVVVADGRAALEWTTEGTSPSGEPFRYDGVSILEMEDGHIARFRAYFDPASLGRQLQGH
jgi:ketosteroid isomerase-like protein